MKKVYLDYNATYPMSAKHLKQLVESVQLNDGNPSTLHYAGRAARLAVEAAREKIAGVLGADKKQLIFTSGATESNNQIIKGLVERNRRASAQVPVKVLTSAIEHSSVHAPLKLLAEAGVIDWQIVGVDSKGQLNEAHLLDLIPNAGFALIAVMMANNEVGCINSVIEIAKAAKAKNPEVFFHSDMVQALGKLDLSKIATSSIDSASFSGHKIGSLKGIGALYCKNPKSIEAMLHGGNQELGLRSGTENVPGILSFAYACDKVGETLKNQDKVRSLSRTFIAELTKYGNVTIHSDPNVMIANTVSCYFKGFTAAEVFIALDTAGVAVTTGSACSSGKSIPSRVLLALGCSEDIASNSIRFSLSTDTTREELDYVLKVLLPFYRPEKKAPVSLCRLTGKVT